MLALDLATSTGWAIDGASGTWDLAPGRGESPGMRFVRLRAKLNWVLTAYPFLRLVVIEQAHHRGGAATAICAGLAAIVQEWCAVHELNHAAVHTATLKKHATGRGNAKKHEMIAAARERGWNPVDDNEADALWLLDYAQREIVGVL